MGRVLGKRIQLWGPRRPRAEVLSAPGSSPAAMLVGVELILPVVAAPGSSKAEGCNSVTLAQLTPAIVLFV